MNKRNDRPLNTSVQISKTQSTDDKCQIAECIYDTDPYIYPVAFGECRERAIEAISRLIGMNGTLFDYRNIIVARADHRVCGVCVLSGGSGSWSSGDILDDLGEDFAQRQLRDGFIYASEHYFSRIGEGLDHNEVELVICCVHQDFRRMHIASRMLDCILDPDGEFRGKRIQLTVLEENKSAIKLYRNKGFRVVEEDVPGFAAEGLPRPATWIMARDVL